MPCGVEALQGQRELRRGGQHPLASVAAPCYNRLAVQGQFQVDVDGTIYGQEEEEAQAEQCPQTHEVQPGAAPAIRRKPDSRLRGRQRRQSVSKSVTKPGDLCVGAYLSCVSGEPNPPGSPVQKRFAGKSDRGELC